MEDVNDDLRALCECRHTLGEHTADRRMDCLYGRSILRQKYKIDRSQPMCSCRGFVLLESPTTWAYLAVPDGL